MYPIVYEADFNPEPNRATTFFRLILAIPWLIVAIFWGLLFAFTHLFAWIAIIVLGRYPTWLYDFNSGVIRFGVRINAWMYLQTDEWPPFGLDEDTAYPIRLAIPPQAPARQSRLKALFRVILVLPITLVLWAAYYVHMGAAIAAWLTIVFRGYMPEALHHVLTFVNGLAARVAAYTAFLTDSYPPIGVEKGKAEPGAEQVPAPTAPTPPAAAA